MRLATRCPSCTTMFLVVEDQLRVSEGWVRCGRCANVFNAVDDLIDVEQGTPVQLDIDSLQAGARLDVAASPPQGAGAAVPEQAIDDRGDPSVDPWPLRPAEESARPAPLPPAPPELIDAPEPGYAEAPSYGSTLRVPQGDAALHSPEGDDVPPMWASPPPAPVPPWGSETAASLAAIEAAEAGPLQMAGMAAIGKATAAANAGADDLGTHVAGRAARARDAAHLQPAQGVNPGVSEALRRPPPASAKAGHGRPMPAAEPAETAKPTKQGVARPGGKPVRTPANHADDGDDDLPDHLLHTPSQQFEDDGDASSAVGIGPGWSSLSPTEPAASDHLPPAGEAADTAPSFVRAAERAQRWKRSPLRTALGVLAGLLLLLAAAQTALLWRDTVAAKLPAAAPLLQAACQPLGCSVQALRRIDKLAVDSSALTRVDDGSDPAQHRYRLAVLLRNKASTALMAPAIELTLTDPRGDTVARRVLLLADFGQPAQAMAAGQELPLRLLLATGPQRVEGYTVEIFYP